MTWNASFFWLKVSTVSNSEERGRKLNENASFSGDRIRTNMNCNNNTTDEVNEILKDSFIQMFLFPWIHSISISGINLLLSINIISLTINNIIIIIIKISLISILCCINSIITRDNKLMSWVPTRGRWNDSKKIIEAVAKTGLFPWELTGTLKKNYWDEQQPSS